MKAAFDAGTATLRLPGRLDGQTLTEFKTETRVMLGDEGVQRIVLDFRAVDYVDSMALGALLLLRERSVARNKALSLVDVQPKVRSLLSLANVHKLFDIR